MAGLGSRPPPSPLLLAKEHKTTIFAVHDDVLCVIFASLGVVELARCAAVCKSWYSLIDGLKLLQLRVYSRQVIEQSSMERHRLSLLDGPANVFQWKGHLSWVCRCRMKNGSVLTGAGDNVLRLWSVDSYKFLDEFRLPVKAPLIDFDYDENKVVGLVGTRICIWTRRGTRNVFSSREGIFAGGSCLGYMDTEAVVGAKDGNARVFDMYSRRCSQVINMHYGSISCLSLSEDKLLVTGSSLGGISISDFSTDQRALTLGSNSSAGIKTLCFNPCSNLVFAGSIDGLASCWDIRASRILWQTRVSSNVIYSMNHRRNNDTSTLVIGGIDGVLRIIDQGTGEVLSRCIMDETKCSSSQRKVVRGHQVIEKKAVRRLKENERLYLMSAASRPPITCLAVGMERVVTMHNDRCVRVWKFS